MTYCIHGGNGLLSFDLFCLALFGVPIHDCLLRSNTVTMNLVIVPGTLVRVDAAAWGSLTLALAAKELRDVIDLQELLERRHVC